MKTPPITASKEGSSKLGLGSRWFKYLAFTLLGGALAVAVGFARDLAREVLPPQLKNLPTEAVMIQQEFQKRLDAAFPEGSSEAMLIAGLSSWGFDFFVGEQGQLWAEFTAPSFLCTDGFSVEWDNDARGNVEKIEGFHHLSCL